MKKKLIVDVGAGEGKFTRLLKKRNPAKEVIGIDRLVTNHDVTRRHMGEFFANMGRQDAERLHAVWMNHVDVKSMEAHRELVEIAKRLPPKTPIIMTVREESLVPTLLSAKHAGLRVVVNTPFTGKMIGSNYTKKYLEESKSNPDKKPIRLVLVRD